MNKNELSIATMTWARDEAEETLMRQALTELAKLNIPTYITDGGSSISFLTFIKNFPNFYLTDVTVRGVWPQINASLAEAYKSNTKYILYTEPDKFEFFKNGLLDMLNENATEQTGVLIASRSPNSFHTFPAFQQMTEAAINNCCGEIVSKQIDFTYGPFLINTKLVPYIQLIQEDIGWGWRTYTFGIAKRLGYSVQEYQSSSNCPVDQQKDNAKERILRMKQLKQQVDGILLSTTIQIEQ